MGLSDDQEELLLRSVAIQNAKSILQARRRAEQELVAAKEALEVRTRELERANDLVRTITENAASCLVMLDVRGVATYMNPAAVEQTGYTLEELAEMPVHDLLHGPPSHAGHAPADCAIRSAREQLVPLRNHRDVFVRKDGSAFPVSCAVAPLQRDGLAAGAVLEFRDITEEQVAQKALEDTNRRKDEFLATLSHELRTPMTAVLGWVRLLRIGLSETETRDAIEAIEKSAEIQAQLIDDVLDVSRIVAGKMTFHPVPVDVAPALHAAMRTVHPAAAAKSIEILASIPPQLPAVLGDEGRLQQVFWNLLSNAVKFTPRDGSITVRVEVSATLLRLTVTDTGKGIARDYLPRVFEPFSQEDGTMTRSHEGIGLGLSIARSLVELHGGRIRVESDGAGRGATFTVELPVIERIAEDAHSRPSAAGPAPNSRPALPSMRGLRVLVIDDQEPTLAFLAAIFRRAEAEVATARSVREGLVQFQAFVPDVVVCDLAMPEEDGFAFLREVRALPTTSRPAKIVAVTAFGRPEDRKEALEAGFDAYLKKPLDPQELAACVLKLATHAE